MSNLYLGDCLEVMKSIPDKSIDAIICDLPYGTTQRGVSDRIACLPNGDTWFVELKRPKGGFMSPMQELFAESMIELKQQYILLNTAKAINEWAAGIKL